VRRTADVDGVEANGSDPNQNLVLPYRRDRSFLENDLFSLRIRFEKVRFPSQCCEPLGRESWW
jgi:hypothetical protein